MTPPTAEFDALSNGTPYEKSYRQNFWPSASSPNFHISVKKFGREIPDLQGGTLAARGAKSSSRGLWKELFRGLLELNCMLQLAVDGVWRSNTTRFRLRGGPLVIEYYQIGAFCNM